MEEIQSAKGIFDSFLRIFQAIKLYPEKNKNRLQAIAKFYSQLTPFLKQYGFLGFEIRKKEVLYSGEIIYEQTGRSGDFIFTLYRDGMQWLEFLDGVTIEEVERLLKILDEYSRPSTEESEEDLLARLWGAHFPDIIFQDVLEEGDLLPQIEPDSQKVDFIREKTIPEICSYLLSLPEDPGLVGFQHDSLAEELKLDEQLNLERMKTEEDQIDPVSEVFDILESVYCHEEQRDLLLCLLDLLRDGIRQALSMRDLVTASGILSRLRQHMSACGRDHWTCAPFEDSFRLISGPYCLDHLFACIKDKEDIPFGDLKNILLALHPDAIQFLIPVAVDVWSPRLREVLMEAITALAVLDVGQLRKIPKDSDPKLIFAVMDVLRNLRDKEAAEILLGYIFHSDDLIVTYAVKTMRDMNAWFPHAVFKLIDRDSSSVQKIVLEYLGSRKCEKVEKLLINYLEARQFHATEKEFALQCFRTLGRCGSLSAQNYLGNMLSEGAWYRRIFKSIKLEGAAAGLKAMENMETGQPPDMNSAKPGPSNYFGRER